MPQSDALRDKQHRITDWALVCSIWGLKPLQLVRAERLSTGMALIADWTLLSTTKITKSL